MRGAWAALPLMTRSCRSLEEDSVSRYQVEPYGLTCCMRSIVHSELDLRLFQVTADGFLAEAESLCNVIGLGAS
jgi:hypothetical protein